MSDLLAPFEPYLARLNHRQSQMLQETIGLAEINSGSLNAKGVNRVLAQPAKADTTS